MGGVPLPSLSFFDTLSRVHELLLQLRSPEAVVDILEAVVDILESVADILESVADILESVADILEVVVDILVEEAEVDILEILLLAISAVVDTVGCSTSTQSSGSRGGGSSCRLKSLHGFTIPCCDG